MKMQQRHPEVFFGPVFCASLYSSLHNTPAGLVISKEKDAAKQLSIALIAVLGDKASKFRIDSIIAGTGTFEVSEHAHKVKQLLSGQMDFEVKHTSNFEIFYLATGMPRGFYIESLSPEDEKFLNNLFIKYHLIISSAEMKALGFNGSDPYPALNKITSVENRIVLTGKNGSVCVIAESEKLQQLRKSIPQPILISPAQALAILYKSGIKEEKYGPSTLKSLQTIEPNPTQLSEAFNKLSIRCHVDLEDPENLKVVASPEEHAKIHKICDECLQPLDSNLCHAISLETGIFEKSITSELLATWLGDDNFALLRGPAIIVDSSGLQKLRGLKREWLEVDSDSLNLLRYFAPQNEVDGASAGRVIEQLRQLTIIPEKLSVEVRESTSGNFQISVPVKYKNEILMGLSTFFWAHSLVVTPKIMEILYQQTGIKEIKLALNKLQQDERVGRGFITLKNDRSYLFFKNEDDIDKFESYWIRYSVSISSLCNTAVKLQAKSQGCEYKDFKSCCHFLKIIAEHPSHYFNFHCVKPQQKIRIDTENLQKLNSVLANYVSITPQVHCFIITLLPQMREFVHWQMVEDSKQYVIAQETLDKVFEEVMAAIPALCKSTLTGKVIEKTPCIPRDNEIWDLADIKEDVQGSASYIMLSQLEAFILNWKMQHNFVPLEYQKLVPILEKPELEQYVERSSSSFGSLARNMQTLMAYRKSNRILSSEDPLNLSDSKSSFSTVFSIGPDPYYSPIPSPHSSTGSSLRPTPTPSRAPSPDPDPSPGSSSRFIGGHNPGSSPSLTSATVYSSAAEELISCIL